MDIQIHYCWLRAAEINASIQVAGPSLRTYHDSSRFQSRAPGVVVGRHHREHQALQLLRCGVGAAGEAGGGRAGGPEQPYVNHVVDS